MSTDPIEFWIENQKWYHNFAKDFNKFDLITGDAGLLSKDLELLQKIEYACICMISGTASIGSNCIMKHFTPHNSRIKNSKEASGFFVNYLYLYYLLFDELKLIKPLTSNPNSGEFYVIGKGFRGINEENYNKDYKLDDDEDEDVLASVKSMLKIAQKLDFKKEYRLADKLTYILRKKI